MTHSSPEVSNPQLCMLPKLTSAVNTGLEMLLLLSGSEGGAATHAAYYGQVCRGTAGDDLRASEYHFLVQWLSNETVAYKIFLFSLPKAANSPLVPRAVLAVPKLTAGLGETEAAL